MADNGDNGDKSEKPTAQKLRKAREQGQIVRSRDVTAAVGILVSLKLLVLTLPDTLDDFRRLFAQSFVPLAGDGVLDNVWSTAFSDAMWLLAKMLLPLLVVPLAITLGSLFPGGWMFNATHLQPRFERLSPLSNLKRLFTAKHASDVLLPIAKATVLALALYYTCRTSIGDFMGLQAMALDRALVRGSELMLDSVMALAMVFVVFALIDMPIQKFVFLRGQRMSHRDLKEEYKESEGSPEVRQRIRQLQRQFARRGLSSSVPKADAVIVNPEHYAVAVKYDEKRAEAPFVVAKGVDEMALYIRELAGQHAIPIIPLPPLARAIYNTSQVNQQIPAALYKAVAQVLHYVLQLKAFQSGRRSAQPLLPDVNIPSHLS